MGSNGGGVVGYQKWGTTENCYSINTVNSGDYGNVGGVVGNNYLSAARNCYHTGTVSGSQNARIGGVVGYQNQGEMNNCCHIGEVHGNGTSQIGGVGGYICFCTVQNCYNGGTVTGGMSSDVGGVAGYLYKGTVDLCYNTGAIFDGQSGDVGGVDGEHSQSTVRRSLNTGTVHGDAEASIGGIVGRNTGTTQDCLNTGKVEDNGSTSYTLLGGVVGQNATIIQTCLNIGRVSGNPQAVVGGVLGDNMNTDEATVTECTYLDSAASSAVGADKAPVPAVVNPTSVDSFTDQGALPQLDFTETWFMSDYMPLLKGFQYLLYDPNGGEGWMALAPSFDGVFTAEDGMFTRTHYDFTGWDTQADGEGTDYAADDEITVTGDTLTVYAQWAKTLYTISFRNGDTLLASVSLTCEERPVYTGEAPVKAETEDERYDWIGWTDSHGAFFGKDEDLPIVTGSENYSARYRTVYKIDTEAELAAFAARVNGGETDAWAILTGDIVMTGTNWTPIGDFLRYTGTFDGQGHTITGMSNEGLDTVQQYGGMYTGGVVGYLAGDGTVENCRYSGTISGGENAYVGGIVGYQNGIGTVENCSSSATVTGGEYAKVGGIVGFSKGTVQNCSSSSAIGGGEYAAVGGVVGQGSGSKIESCSNSGAISGGEHAHIGGVVGINYSGVVKDCSNANTVTGEKAANTGGVVGYNQIGTVQNCLNTGEAAGGDNANVGGIIGENTGIVTGCLNTGAASVGKSANIGGVVGYNQTGAVQNCLNTGAAAGSEDAYVGGVVGYNERGTVQDCLNAGAVSAPEETDQLNYEGGAVGYNENGKVQTCLNIGKVEGTAAGGIVGMNTGSNSTVDNCFFCDTAAAKSVGENSGNVMYAAAFGAEQMKVQANFIGFDFAEAWFMSDHMPLLPGYRYFLYDPNGGDGFLAMDASFGADFTVAENMFTRSHYEFTGWDTQANGEGTDYAAGDEITITDDLLTLYAQWKKNVFTITFVDEDGTPLESKDVAFGETPTYTGETPTKAPTVEHTYTFAGWTPEITAVEGEATYTAVYDEHDREYDGPVWAWTGYTAAKATFTAKDDATFTQVLDAAITNAVTTPETCTEDGVRTYTASVTFLGTNYTDDKTEPIPQKGHDWGEPTYEWEAIPGGYTCTATRVCKNDAAHTESETVGSTYAVIEEAKPYVDGLGRYTSAAFANEAFAVQTMDVMIPMLHVTFVCDEMLAMDSYVIENGEKLFMANIRITNLPDGGAIEIDSAQLFLKYDPDLLVFRRAEGPVKWVVSDRNDMISAVWASETDLPVKDGDVLLTLYFSLARAANPDEQTTLMFTESVRGVCAVSYIREGVLTELEADTVNGGILFETPLYGDANGDGTVTAADAALILRVIVGLDTLSPRDAFNADVDLDGEITATDAALILRFVVGLIPSLPV